jgi:type IV pilus assembly protein PilQ
MQVHEKLSRGLGSGIVVLLMLAADVSSGKTDEGNPVKVLDLVEIDGETKLTIGTERDISYSMVTIESPPRLIVDIASGVIDRDELPDSFATGLVAKVVIEHIEQPVLGSFARVSLHLTGEVEVERDEGKRELVLTLAPLGGGPAPAPAAPAEPAAAGKPDPQATSPAHASAPPPKAEDAETIVKAKPKTSPALAGSKVVGTEDASIYSFTKSKTAAAVSSVQPQVGLAATQPKKKYTGKRIDLDFKDADIHNILRLLSDVGNINIVASDDVKGSVTLRMRDVPWDLALNVILAAKGLGKVKLAQNLYRVAPKATLEKEQQMKIKELKAKQVLKPLITKILPVSYAMAADLASKARDLLSSRGKITVDERTNVLIVRDVAENMSLIEQLIMNLDTQTPQVLIEARIVEATSTYSRELGIQWGGHVISSSATGNPTGLVFPNSVMVAGGGQDDQTPESGMNPFGEEANPNFAVNLPATVGTGSGGALGISLGSVANNANLNLRISALETDGILRIISAPKILTLDNKEAKIEQGTMIPYSQISAQGVQTAFQEAKLSLEVTPHVTADGSILMKAKITRDEPDFNNTGARGDPTILKREAETELLIEDARTAVIGGIYTRNYGKSYSQVPFLAKIPVLGWLFKKRTDTDRRTELLIFLTPRIVNRAESIGK